RGKPSGEKNPNKRPPFANRALAPALNDLVNFIPARLSVLDPRASCFRLDATPSSGGEATLSASDYVGGLVAACIDNAHAVVNDLPSTAGSNAGLGKVDVYV